MPAPLEIIDAHKTFRTPEGGTLTALDGVSLKLAAAEFVTLLGPSGCGKTTLLRTISGFETLDAGDIVIDGAAVTQLPAHRRPVNTVFQRYALFGHMSVARNVGYALEIAGRDKREIRTRVGEMLELVGLAGLGKRMVSQLSGGQQQRVALARALAGKPKLLLLDEPLSALDKNLRQKMQQELKALQRELGIGFIFVTHDQEEALTMSDRIAVLAHGRIQQIGAPSALYQTPVNLFTADFLGESNLLPVTLDGQVARLADGQGFACDRPAGQATLLLRPEALGLARPEGPALRFSGTIGEVYYTGKDHQVTLQAEALGTLRALLRTGSPLPEPGAGLELFAPATGLHLIDEVAS
ncbi:ABC transporter ATP-binding protein [Pseudodonghicola flavimaris]|uniref:ABC transporter ATP-binding protein n=1 Tax=Pseudodonghicola flavimaris TaxID=3050036 RepID=A0ABT7F3Q2_9RHOB|nr:ABC transporter ATP-binding protein [Pseudodonghicola flavimaris]MDK3019239.1 ABC transporter ATP-binding protein [Pseudodonghicola flavimaris]